MRMDRKASLLLSSLLLVVALPLNATQVGGPRPSLPPLQPLEGVWEATVRSWQYNSGTGGYIEVFTPISASTREGCEAQLSNIDSSATIVKFCTFRAY